MKILLATLFVLSFSIDIMAQNDFERIVLAEKKRYLHIHKSLQGAENNNNIIYQRLNLNVNPNVDYIDGKVTTYFIAESSINYIEFDLSDSLSVDSVVYHNASVSFTHSSDIIHINFLSPVLSGQTDSISVFYQGVPSGSGFGSFVQNYHDSVPIIWTLSEPYGAKDWWPCKQDLSDKIDSIDILVTAPDSFKTASNGLLVDVIHNGNLNTYHWKHRYPIAAYLVCFATTNYEVYTDTVPYGSDTLTVFNYVYPENIADARSGTANTVKFIQLFDSLFGIYPFQREKYGQTQFGWGGGMEHQTMTFVTDFGFELLAHELGHHWFGDKVTCASWADIWLNEGFATYLSMLCYEHIAPQYWKPSLEGSLASALLSPNGSVWCDDTTSVNRIFDGHLSYAKGAMVLHHLRFVLGDSLFFLGLRNYLNDPNLAYSFATTSDLRQHFEAVSGLNLTKFFNDWIYGKGFPIFTLNWKQDFSNHVSLSVHQEQSDPSVSFFEMPVMLRFKNALRDTDVIINSTSADQTFSFNLSFAADSLIFDPDIWDLAKSTVIREPSYQFSFYIFPNPVNEQLQMSVETLNSENAQMKIYNEAGALVWNGTNFFNSGNTLYNIDVRNLLSGVYHFSIRVSGKTFTSSFVKITH